MVTAAVEQSRERCHGAGPLVLIAALDVKNVFNLASSELGMCVALIWFTELVFYVKVETFTPGLDYVLGTHR